MMAGAEPCMLTLTEASRSIKEGKLSPVELTRSCLSMIDRLEPQVKAWVTLDRQGALREAARFEDERQAGQVRGLLHGIPIGIKDIFYTAGMRTTAGHAPMAEFVPDYDSAVVERLKAAGAIILGKTTTTEFALLAPTPTRNPWNLEHTPGGSSSGSGAAVAARMCPAAIGTQTGGSTLRPSAYCGATGLKPTYGRVSTYGMIPLAPSTDHPGIIARAVCDLALMLHALAGHDPRDDTSAFQPVHDYVKALEAPVKAPRIALMGGDFHDKASEEIRATVRGAAERFRAADAYVEEMEPPMSFPEAQAAFRRLLTIEGATGHREALEKRPQTFNPKTREFLERGLTMPAPDYVWAKEIQRRMRKESAEIFERFDVILVPTAPTTAPAGLESTGDPIFNNPWSMTGNPAVSLPSGLSESGLPLAIQLVGPSFAEGRLLAIAQWCESLLAFSHVPQTLNG
jgi:Asp-tRNA(Asn)/Glu-tRNA(Gln) amidotransferase A subunit family amidase